MWKTIGGFVVSNFTEVFVKELVKEISKPKKPARPNKDRNAVSASTTTKGEPQQPITFTKGQVMVFEWVPTSKQEIIDQTTKGTIPKDLGEKLKRIEKLAKQIRNSLNP
jgi:hypothetical protein